MGQLSLLVCNTCYYLRGKPPLQFISGGSRSHVNTRFVTSNGYNEYIFSDKITLGSWINTQRICYRKGKLTKEQISLLENIGMIWSVKKNQEEIMKLCKDLNINTNININKYILNNISIQELQSKIEYLKSNNIPLTHEDGTLHDIFDISSTSMKEKYGVSLEEIINNYLSKENIKNK